MGQALGIDEEEGEDDLDMHGDEALLSLRDPSGRRDATAFVSAGGLVDFWPAGADHARRQGEEGRGGSP